MSNIYPLLPRLTVNSRFIDEFIIAEAPCCALGLVEERKQTYGFLALRPKMVIPDEYTRSGFSFGHSLYGNADFVVIHFAFHFYNYATFNVLVNPNNPVVQTVLNKILETRDYFFFAVDPKGSVTAFRSELGQEDLIELKSNLPRIKNAKTTDAQYLKAVAAFEKNQNPPGRMLNWVCRDNMDYLDLTQHREELNPVSKPVKPNTAAVSDEAIESRLIPCEHCGEWAAQLIFADDSADENEIEVCARKMVAQYSDINVPTWVIGEPLGEPGFNTRTRILKVWPRREPIRQMTADAFNAELDALLARHCKAYPNPLDKVFKPTAPKKFEKPCSPGHSLKMLNENMRTDILRSVHEGFKQHRDKMDKKSPLELLIKSIEGVVALFGSVQLSVERNPFNADPHYRFDPEQDYKHDIALLKFQLKELKKTLKDIRSSGF